MPKEPDKEDPISRNNFFSKLKSFKEKFFAKNTKLIMNADDFSEPTTEGEIISNIDNFSEKTLEDIMIPRSDIISIALDADFEEIRNLVIKHAHTRTLVYKERLDNIVGFVHIKDLFAVNEQSKKFNLNNVIRKHIISPHSMKLIDLLSQMQKARTHIAVIVDEYGGTDGLVTIDDIIEEIVGNIDDEHDIKINNDYKIIKNGIIVTNSRVAIETFEDILKVKLKKSDDDFETIGGLVIAIYGKVPNKGRVIHITKEISAEILEATPRTIKQIKITYPVK